MALDSRPFNVSYIENPTQTELRTLAKEHTPAVQVTNAGSINKISRNKARQAKYTYIVDDRQGAPWSHNTMTSEKAASLIARQTAYIEKKGTLIAVDAYVGLGERAFGATWLYTVEGANIAGMQQVLSFPRADVEPPDVLNAKFVPTFRLIYTPDLFLDDMPGRQAIIVDIKNWTTHVIGADYFGESKKGVLRMLNHYVLRARWACASCGSESGYQEEWRACDDDRFGIVRYRKNHDDVFQTRGSYRADSR